MSRKYEALIVLNTKGGEDQVEGIVSTLSEQFKAEGATVQEVEHLGRRKFAYPSGNLESGYYLSFTIQAEPTAIAPLKKRLKLNEDVHLQHYQLLEA